MSGNRYRIADQNATYFLKALQITLVVKVW